MELIARRSIQISPSETARGPGPDDHLSGDIGFTTRDHLADQGIGHVSFGIATGVEDLAVTHCLIAYGLIPR